VTHRDRRSRGRAGRLLGAAVISLGLVAGACSKDDTVGSDDDATEETTATEGSTEATEPDTDTETTESGSGGTTATTAATEDTEPAEPAAEVVRGGTLVVSGEAEVANAWLPATMQCDSYCQQRARTFYDPLIAINEDLEPVGVLVETFESNEDFTLWTFKVREGITFHDGTPFNAEAAVTNLQKSGTGLLISNAIKDYGKNPDGSLAITAVDEYTFTIQTGRNGDLADPVPWPDLPSTLAGQLGLIASPTWLAAVEAETADPTMAIGTGPFKVQSYAPRDRLVVVRNEDYWMTDPQGEPYPYLDSIEFRVIEDSETAGEALQSGDIDIFSTSSALVISEFRELADEFPMTEQDQLTETNYLLIDLDKPGALQDQRVRCALSMAVDRQELIDLTADGILQVANGLFSPGQEGYLEDNGFDTERNVDDAAAMIEEYESETGEQVVVRYGTTVTQVNAQTAELLQGYWSEIGVDTQIAQVPQDEFITRALFGAEDFYIYGWRNHAGVTVDNQFFWWHSSAAPPDGQLALNFGRVRDDVVDQNLETARSATSEEERQAAAEEVNRRMAEQCYQIPVSWTLWGTPHAAKVQGLGEYVFPDGSTARNGAGFSGQFWVHSLWIDESQA